MRLIDADDFKKFIEKLTELGAPYADIISLLDKQPTIDERPERKWIFTKTIFDKYGYTVECPSCHKKWKTYDEIGWKKEYKFCPNCGAKREVDE